MNHRNILLSILIVFAAFMCYSELVDTLKAGANPSRLKLNEVYVNGEKITDV